MLKVNFLSDTQADEKWEPADIPSSYKQPLERALSLYLRHNDRPSTQREWMKFARHFKVDRAPSLSPSTFKIYRRALIKYVGFMEFTDAMLTIETPKRDRKTVRTSGKRSKGIAKKKYMAILDSVAHYNGQYKKILHLLVLYSPLTGLRPKEWGGAKLYEGMLLVKNAKYKEKTIYGGVNNFKFRFIPLDHLSIEQRMDVEKLISLIKGKIEEFNSWTAFYQKLRMAFRLVAQRVPSDSDEHISIYTLRHQFYSHLKASRIPVPYGAYLMGHNNTDTAKRKYGRVSKGTSCFNFGEAQFEKIIKTHTQLGFAYPDYLD